MTGQRGRKLAFVLGLGCVGIGGWLLLSWRPLIVDYHLRWLKNSPEYFRETLQGAASGLRSEAFQKYLHTEDGQQALCRVFVHELLDTWVGVETSMDGFLGQNAQRRSLENFSSALLWIGPKTGGIQHFGENVAIHIVLKQSATDPHPAVASYRVVATDEKLRNCKAISAVLPLLRGNKFSLPEYPSVHFDFWSGEAAVDIFGVPIWHEVPPDSQQTVCFAYRSDEKGSDGGQPEALTRTQKE